MKTLTLFIIDGCPFCKRVEHYLAQEQLDIPLRDISKDWNAYRDLKTIGGKIQAPCLVIDGEALYESDDILAWLQERKGDLSAYKKA